MITSKDVADWLRKKPFEPFRIITSSGQAYEITHPEAVMVDRRVLIVGKPSLQYPGEIRGHNFVSILHISDLQLTSEMAHAESNGSMS